MSGTEQAADEKTQSMQTIAPGLHVFIELAAEVIVETSFIRILQDRFQPCPALETLHTQIPDAHSKPVAVISGKSFNSL